MTFSPPRDIHMPPADSPSRESPSPRQSEPSPKRRRVHNGYVSPGYESPDELELPNGVSKSKPLDRQGRSHLPNHTVREDSLAKTPPADDSSDELSRDHIFFLRNNRVGPSTHPSVEPSETADSEDGYLASSPIPSPAPPSCPPEIQYSPKLILRGHKRGLAAVKFSPDGKWIASCSADATCRIWDARTGKAQHTLNGHLAGVSTIAWSPDSKILASGSDDKSIRLWDALTGKAHPEPLLGHHNYVYCLAFSPKGNMLVSGSYDEAVFLWDVRTARLMRSLPAHSDPVSGVDFARDGTLIVSCSSDGLIRVWDTATGQCLRTFFHEDTPPVVSVRFSPNGKYILTWMLDSSVRMWNYVEGRCVKTYQGHKNETYSLTGAFGTYGDPASALIVSGSEDGGVLLWDVNSKNVLQKLGGHEGAVLGVDFHPTEKAVVSCGLDRTIRLWRDDRREAEAEYRANN